MQLLVFGHLAQILDRCLEPRLPAKQTQKINWIEDQGSRGAAPARITRRDNHMRVRKK